MHVLGENCFQADVDCMQERELLDKSMCKFRKMDIASALNRTVYARNS